MQWQQPFKIQCVLSVLVRYIDLCISAFAFWPFRNSNRSANPQEILRDLFIHLDKKKGKRPTRNTVIWRQRTLIKILVALKALAKRDDKVCFVHQSKPRTLSRFSMQTRKAFGAARDIVFANDGATVISQDESTGPILTWNAR